MQNIEKNITSVRQQIGQTALSCGRGSETIMLLAVSKKKPATDIRRARELGQVDFGENYLQEALQKMQQLQDLDICWHFIGAIQSNKTHHIAEAFDWVHCVDRLKIARRLSEHRPPALDKLNLCIQVNIDQEPSKAGISLSEVSQLAQEINSLPNIRLRGLMAIPAPTADSSSQRAAFAKLARALEMLQSQGIHCDTLSMGMSGDMEAAIAEGSTLLRIGTAIFGERN